MKHRIIVLVLAAALLCSLSACKKAPAEPSTEPSTVPATTVAPTTVPSTTAATEATTEAPTEPAGTEIVNPLNGSDVPMVNRPVAAVINNHYSALPQRGTSGADMIFEFLADNCAITRLLAVFSDVSEIGDIGPIRSARPYTFSTARGYDAFYIHFGSSAEASSMIYATDWDDMNGISYDGVYFYRDQNRLNQGYGYEHTAFTTGADILDFIANKDIRFATNGSPDYGYVFDDGKMDGEPATEINVQFGWLDKRSYLEYDEGTGLYTAYEYGDPFYDEDAGVNLTFRNAIVIFVDTNVHEEGIHVVYDLISSGEGVLCRDGVQVPILWHRDSQDDPFHFTYEDGTPASLGVGKTYVALVPLNNQCTFE